MPLIVDREERRQKVASVAFDLVAEQGIEAVTFRQVAGASGTSTAIVSNWFDNKGDLLFEIYRIANYRMMERLETAFMQGLDLLDVIAVVLPVTEETRRTWLVWLAFWGRAHNDPDCMVETARNARASFDLYFRMLARRYGRDENSPDPRIDEMSRRLVATVGGVSLQAMLAPGDWSLASLRQLIATEIAVIDVAMA